MYYAFPYWIHDQQIIRIKVFNLALPKSSVCLWTYDESFFFKKVKYYRLEKTVIKRDHSKGANVGGCITKPGEKKVISELPGERKKSRQNSSVKNTPASERNISEQPNPSTDKQDILDRERILSNRRQQRQQNPYEFAFSIAHSGSSSPSKFSASCPRFLTIDYTKHVWAHKRSMWNTHISEFKTNSEVQLKVLNRPNIEGFREAGNFPDLVIRWKKAEGTGVVPCDMEELMSIVSEYMQASKNNSIFVPDQAKGIRDKFPDLFEKAINTLDSSWHRIDNLIKGLVAGKVYMDEAAAAFQCQSAPTLELKHSITEALYRSTVGSVAIWAFDQLRKHGEVFIPCDQIGYTKGLGHFNVFYLKLIEDEPSSNVLVHRFETLFSPDGHFHKDTINKLLPAEYRYHHGSPFSRLENYFSLEQMGREAARDFYDDNGASCVFSCQETRGFFEYLCDRQSKSLVDDAEKLSKITYPQSFFRCDDGNEIRSRIVSSMQDLGKIVTPNQCIVRIQNPYECEFYSIDAAMRFLINNEASYHLLKLYQVKASEELMRGVIPYSVGNSPSKAELEIQLKFINNNHREGLQRALEQQNQKT